MRIVLFGASDFTLVVARKLVEIGFPPIGVITVPQTFKISYSPHRVTNFRSVDMPAWANNLGIPWTQYSNLEDAISFVSSVSADFGLVAGWYHMVGPKLRACFPKGCVGIHASLLPRYRGGAPLNWAILNGDAETGVSIFSLGDGVDTGDIYGQERFPISPTDYVGDLVEKSYQASCRLIETCIPAIESGLVTPIPQSGVPTYSLQRAPDDGAIDWRSSCIDIEKLVRAASRPYPGAYTSLEGRTVVIWRARALSGTPKIYGQCGQIVHLSDLPGPSVITGDGLLLLEDVNGPDNLNIPSLARLHQRRFDVVPPMPSPITR